ncbi:nuclear transport factor 2 family protein [Geothrix sp. PMB-07]|uniref:nuclear transport factor 2 family protein n=1 Tax=Geothrix sp. PMB-07 TaxID=3068640 RepID=UPI0027421489|nr:nuclear transport factor 2 family protein [Geothrix sp. PMB-07]WLT31175.1 nuclear transport factor 2 family protein [Geothrix sp. PMB-07]
MRRVSSLLLVPALALAAPTPKVLSPTGVVGRQIELFNAHYLEGFLALFAEELEVGEVPAGPTAPFGKAKLRDLYAERFKANPDLHASAEAQMVAGDFVIQKERIKGRMGKPPLEAVVIYQVKAGKILRMWSLND